MKLAQRRQQRPYEKVVDAKIVLEYALTPEEFATIDEAMRQFNAFVRARRALLAWGHTVRCTIIVPADGPCVSPSLVTIWPEFEARVMTRGWAVAGYNPAAGTFDVSAPHRARTVKAPIELIEPSPPGKKRKP